VFSKTDAAAGSPPRWPPQIRYIIGNEACERFSFYGMRNILVVFLAGYLLLDLPPGERDTRARQIFHLFVFLVYFTPLLGGWLADRFWGKYKTILWLSLVYCAGHAFLAIFDHSKAGFYFGLLLIALGAGGIKPTVSAFVGDQFTVSQKAQVSTVYGAFYWAINLGSLTASLLMPKLLKHFGPSVAFGVPGVLMLASTVILVAGRRHYRELPPTGPNPDSFGRVLWTAFKNRKRSAGEGRSFLDGALDTHPRVAVEGARAVLRILRIFAFIPFFWALFDQKASAWVLQARRMDLDVGPFTFEPAQLQFINPGLVMALIPLMTGVVYPFVARIGIRPTPLRRMTVGMFMAGLAFVLTAMIEQRLDEGQRLSVLWQLGPYVALTLAEILVSVTGLEFAYTQAPRQIKSVVQSVWLLTTAIANLVVAALIKALNISISANVFFGYAGMALLAGIVMALMARRFKVRDYFQQVAPIPVGEHAAPGLDPK
jgi:proton-dependent oligopeptide transporter, POT family